MKIIIIGAGGHGYVCAEIASQSNMFLDILFSDNALPIGSLVGEFSVSFHDESLSSVDTKVFAAFVGVGQTKDSMKREGIFNRLIKLGFDIPTLICESSYISQYAVIGKGTVVSHMAVVNTRAQIGENCIINSKALVEHDSSVGNHTHISTASVVNGNCVIGSGCMIGSNAVVNQGCSITSNVIIGSGSVVTRDIVQSGVYYGVPAVRRGDF